LSNAAHKNAAAGYLVATMRRRIPHLVAGRTAALILWQGADQTGANQPGRAEAWVDEEEIRTRIEILRRDHRDLDAAIEALRQMPMVDMIQLQRFKKRKLRLRDEIAMLEDMLIPDIIA
jgi:hypothetical protein